MQFDLSASAKHTNKVTNFLGSTYFVVHTQGFRIGCFLEQALCLLNLWLLGSTGVDYLLFIQAYSKNLHPDPCDESSCLGRGEALMFYCA
ncbi:OLC1v1005174C1 [Oldenlandia corymbosa var. corymbosa]|uniref:OLC1v1005174C1 n=1 Tax=Oldenlandia corymbosa var. corymbosa TaxID=529605 RepID=A0AAV1DE28_OLDCO|nr:OLC1v1005174C1 [Oldenlandia corymbosa var. corymbosa]